MAPKKKNTSAFNKFLLVGLVFAGFCVGMICQSQMSMGKGRSGPDMMQLFEEAAHQGDQLGISNPVPIVKPIIRSPEKDAPDLFDDSNPKEDIPLDPDPGLLDSPGIPDTVDAPGPPEGGDESPPSSATANSLGSTPSMSSLDSQPSLRRQPLQEPKVARKIENTSIERKVGCNQCCNDGTKNGPCFDVEDCAAGVTGGRYAFVYAHVGDPGWPWLTFLDSMWAQALKLEEVGAVADIVVLRPGENIRNLGCQHRRLIEQYHLRIIEVPWTIPPKSWYPSYWWPGKADGWCGPQDLMRLHALALDDYDAVVFYDQDVEFQGDMTPVLKCAARGYFISASGGVGEPFNVGFFALRPDKRLLRAAEIFGASVNFTVETGWGNCGFRPSGSKFVGAECGQGFFHTLFYKTCKPVKQALLEAGLRDVKGNPRLPLQSVMVDRCIWNYQNDGDCGNGLFSCNAIQVHHKPTSKPDNDRLCGKLKFHKGGWTGAKRDPFPAPPIPIQVKKGGTETCVATCVELGNNCICNQKMPPPHHIKNVTIKGHPIHCQETIRSPSKDVFAVSIIGKSKLQVKRVDAESCWCDNVVVECCVAS